MSLRVFYSERIEDLARHMKLRLLAERSVEDAFAFSQVVVPNANIAKWLRIRAFADAPSLCAGIEFPFIEQALYRAMNASLPPSERAELLPMNAYATGIMAVLQGERVPALEPFYAYAASKRFDERRYPWRAQDEESAGEGVLDEGKAWQLCTRLADLLDQYEVRRGDIIAQWLAGRGMKGGGYADATEAAEAELARRLFGRGGIYPPDGNRLSLRQLYERVERVCPGGPADGRRIYRFFGLSTLNPLQVRIFRWLAKGADVEVYHNNVCLEYWGDIETNAESRRLQRLCKNVQDDVDFAIENPLLREWGVAGRETMRLLASLEEDGDETVAFEWHDISGARQPPSSVLESVQRAICRRTGTLERMAQDASLQVVAAPGIRREVEMVHNAILGLMLHDAECSFSDVAVLVTDMKSYKPMIEAVFRGRGSVPFGLIDASVSGQSDSLDAFSALTSFALKGLTRTTLFAVLSNPCIQRSLEFGMDDVRAWRRLADEIGAFSGFEDAGDFRNFTWEAALARMRLGFIAEDSPDCAVCLCADDNALKFSEVVERLYRELAPLGCAKATFAQWAQTLREIISRYIDVGEDTGESYVVRAISEMLSSLGCIPGEHGLAMVSSAIEELVGGMKASRSGYLTHGVTVASLQPMRPVPFRHVFVLGMGQGDFPGRESASTLDMRGTKRGLGDASLPMQNRYLFLETLMAVRGRLVISYPSLDMQKDAELFPSGLVSELESFIESAILPDGEKFHEIPLPLLERGGEGDCTLADPVGKIEWRGYWAGIIPTYSSEARRLAMAVASGAGRRREGRGEGAGADAADVSARELAAFITDPVAGMLTGRFGVSKEYDDGDAGECPLELAGSGKDKWDFDKAALDGCAGDGGDDVLERLYDDFAAHGKVPGRDSFFGAYSFSRISQAYGGGEGGGFLRFARDFLDSLPTGGEGFTRVVVLKNSVDVRAASKKVDLPPRATIAPFVEWLMRLSERRDARKCTLEVAIVDFDNMVCPRWRWKGVTAKKAKAALAAIVRRYNSFAVAVAGDGRYLRTGYKVLAGALDAMQIPSLPGNDDEEAWRDLADEMQQQYVLPPSIVLAATAERLERMPSPDDWKMVRDFCRDVFPMVLQGERVEDE